MLLLTAAFPCAAQVVYRTDFENFPVGPDKLVGTEGWAGVASGSGSHGIDQDAIPGGGLGKTAFIGYAPPSGTTNPVHISRPVNLNPATNSTPIIEFETLLGIKDSTNNYRDGFWIAFMNTNPTPNRLAAIHFQNEAASTWIWRSDGAVQANTGINFIPGELHLLYVRIDLTTNKWSAYLDDIPLFNGAEFTATAFTRTLGSVRAEWRRGNRLNGDTTWGNNWMLIADWTVRMVPFSLDSSTRNANGSFTLKWIGDPGRSYQVQHSSDLGGWQNTLSGSTFPVQSGLGNLSFTDAAPPAGKRFYRVLRNSP